MIIDVHGHVGEYPTHYSEKFARIIGGAFDQDPKEMWTIKREKIIEDMDQAGVSKMVIQGMDITACNFGTRIDSDYIYNEYTQPYPDRFIGFAGVQPMDEQGFLSQEKISDFKHAVDDLGFKGLKANPSYCHFAPNDKRMYPFYQICVERNLPILLHMGTTSFSPALFELGNPSHLDDMAKDFPDLKICAAHMAYPWENQLMGLMRNNKNIYTDISALGVRPRDLALNLDRAREFGMLDRVMYGTDYPCLKQVNYVPMIRTTVNQILDKLNLPSLSKAEINKILGINAQKFLNLK